eukprot:414350-Prorocentrum_minimum.AAC.1
MTLDNITVNEVYRHGFLMSKIGSASTPVNIEPDVVASLGDQFIHPPLTTTSRASLTGERPPHPPSSLTPSLRLSARRYPEGTPCARTLSNGSVARICPHVLRAVGPS